MNKRKPWSSAMDFLKGLGGSLVGVDGTKLDPRRLTTLENLLKHKFGATVRVAVVQRFTSKKNVVFQLRIQGKKGTPTTDTVAKLFVTDRFENELRILRVSHEHGLTVPEVLASDQGVIVMSFIPGEPLVERLNRTFDPELIDELAEWYYKYHAVHDLIKGDPRLRNFIYDNRLVFGLDFEESQPGHWILDIGGIAASLLDTAPIFDRRKRILAWRLLEKYLALKGDSRNTDVDRMFIETVSNTLKETAYWRKDDSILFLAERVSQLGIPVD